MDLEPSLAAAKRMSVIGEDLSALSVAELEQRTRDLEAEIIRVKADLARKQASIGAADALFLL